MNGGLHPGGAALAVGVVVALSALAPRLATADDPGVNPATCDAWDVEYSLAANVELSDTTMGAGDGVHRIGPGIVIVRFDSVGGRPGGAAKMLRYEMKDTFTVVAKALFWGTTVHNDTRTTVTPDACGVAADGLLIGRTLRWVGALNGMRTDGNVTCEGSLCGKFGAPPAGKSDVHTPPHAVTFKPFEFAADMQTFTMQYSVVSRFESPRQTSRITLAGREAKRTCVPVKPPCPAAAAP